MAEIKQPVSSQPQGTPPMQVGGNKNAKNCPIGPDGRRDWSFGLFDCFGRCGLCCLSTFCPCVVYGKSRQRLRSLQAQGIPLAGDGDTFDAHCCIYCLIGDCSWILQIRTREDIRERYRIRGDVIGDCFASWCCRPCALTQERREIELEENSF